MPKKETKAITLKGRIEAIPLLGFWYSLKLIISDLIYDLARLIRSKGGEDCH